MDIPLPGNQNIEETTQTEQTTKTDGIRIFETEAWIPIWEQSIPGESIALGSVPTSCNLYLEPDLHFAIEINLAGEDAIQHLRIINQQGEQTPMQFEGLEYDNYPIRGNNYVSWGITNNDLYIHAKYRLLDKGLRTLRIADNPTAEVHGFVINLAIENYEPLTIALNEWTVTLSPQMRDDNDDSKCTVTHKIKIANSKGPFSDTELENFRDNLRIVFSVINIKCCEIVLTQTFDIQSSHTGYMIDQLHCDDFNYDVLQYTLGSSQRNQEFIDIASKIYKQVVHSQPHYLEGLEMLTCSSHQSIPSFWTILEKTCGSGPASVRRALQTCVESIKIPSEYTFLKEQLSVEQNADFIDIFYGMRNHFAHEKNKITRGQSVPPETHTIVKKLAQLLCWCKVLTDIDVKCLLWQEARVSFANWDFKYSEGQPTTFKNFQADGTYNALAAIRRILRGGETPRQTSAYFETPEGEVVICEATEWPKEMPKR